PIPNVLRHSRQSAQGRNGQPEETVHKPQRNEGNAGKIQSCQPVVPVALAPCPHVVTRIRDELPYRPAQRGLQLPPDHRSRRPADCKAMVVDRFHEDKIFGCPQIRKSACRPPDGSPQQRRCNAGSAHHASGPPLRGRDISQSGTPLEEGDNDWPLMLSRSAPMLHASFRTGTTKETAKGRPASSNGLAALSTSIANFLP